MRHPAVQGKGVSVSENLERLQGVQKEILSAFDAFCTKHSITYFLVAGSALGAVRHGDVIPWDDDVDVGMLRADYNRFLSAAGHRLSERLFVQTFESDPNYPLSYAKLRLDGTVFHEDAVDSLEMNKGIFIDIFPFDNVSGRRGVPRWRFLTMSLLSLLATSVTREICEQSSSAVIRKVRHAAYALRHVMPHRTVHRWYDRLAQAENSRRTELVCCFDMYSLRNYRKTIFAKEGLVPPRPAQFGGMVVPIPADADGYLTALFGDYMTPPPAHMRVPAHAQIVDFGEIGS